MKSQAYAARVAKRINKQPRMRVLTDDEPAGKYTLIQCTTVVELVIYIWVVCFFHINVSDRGLLPASKYNLQKPQVEGEFTLSVYFSEDITVIYSCFNHPWCIVLWGQINIVKIFLSDWFCVRQFIDSLLIAVVIGTKRSALLCHTEKIIVRHSPSLVSAAKSVQMTHI